MLCLLDKNENIHLWSNYWELQGDQPPKNICWSRPLKCQVILELGTMKQIHNMPHLVFEICSPSTVLGGKLTKCRLQATGTHSHQTDFQSQTQQLLASKQQGKKGSLSPCSLDTRCCCISYKNLTLEICATNGRGRTRCRCLGIYRCPELLS